MKKMLLVLFMTFAVVPFFAQDTLMYDFFNSSNRPFNTDGDWYGIDTVLYTNHKENDPVSHFRYVFRYDDKGNAIGGKMDQYEDGSYGPRGYFEKEVDELGRDTVQANYSWRGNYSRYMKDRRYAYAYDKNGNLIKKFQQEGSKDEDDVWQNIDLYNYEYNDDNFLMCSERFTYSHEEEPWQSVRDIYLRDEHNNVVNHSNVIHVGGRYFYLYDSNEYQYDELGNMTDSVCWTSEDSLNWWYTVRVKKSFDNVGNMTARTEYEWNEDGEEWIPVKEENWHYDEVGHDTLATVALWNSEIQDFVLNRTKQCRYNEAGALISRQYYGFGDTDRWHFLSRYDCEMDENGNVLMEQRIYEDSLSGRRESYWENLSENAYFRQVETLDTLNGWKNSLQHRFYFDENRNDTLALNYKWSDGEWVPNYTQIILYYNDGQSMGSYNSHWVRVKYKKIPHCFQVEELADENGIAVYPNPVTDKVVVKGEGMKSAEVYDIQGRRILSLSLNQNAENEIDVSQLSFGMYLLKVTAIDGKTSVCKIVK